MQELEDEMLRVEDKRTNRIIISRSVDLRYGRRRYDSEYEQPTKGSLRTKNEGIERAGERLAQRKAMESDVTKLEA